MLTARLKSYLSNLPDLDLAFLLGSIANGKARIDSDLDIAVSFGRPISAEQMTSMIEDLALLSGRAVDLIDLEVARGLILQEVLTHGIPLIQPHPPTLERLLKHQVYDQADFAAPLKQARSHRINNFIHER